MRAEKTVQSLEKAHAAFDAKAADVDVQSEEKNKEEGTLEYVVWVERDEASAMR